MNRLHCWLDQLTLRRSSRRNSTKMTRRAASQSVAPSCRLNSEGQKQHKKADKRSIPVTLHFPPPPPISELGSIPRRSGIRTNPWVSERSMCSSVERTDRMPLSSSSRSTLDRSAGFDARPPTLGVKSLDESTCSSGYASQDVSPDSSMHLPNWTSASPRAESWKSGADEGFYAEDTPSLYDNIAEEHVYHELMRSYSSEQLPSCSSASASRSSSPLYDRAASPIYATPWVNYPLIQKRQIDDIEPQLKRPTPLVVRNNNCQPKNIIYAQPYRGPLARPHLAESQFEFAKHTSPYFSIQKREIREEKQPSIAVPDDVYEDENEQFLSELDAQINELQIRSEELRCLVERARSRRREWLQPQLECTFELSI